MAHSSFSLLVEQMWESCAQSSSVCTSLCAYMSAGSYLCNQGLRVLHPGTMMRMPPTRRRCQTYKYKHVNIKVHGGSAFLAARAFSHTQLFNMFQYAILPEYLTPSRDRQSSTSSICVGQCCQIPCNFVSIINIPYCHCIRVRVNTDFGLHSGVTGLCLVCRALVWQEQRVYACVKKQGAGVGGEGAP